MTTPQRPLHADWPLWTGQLAACTQRGAGVDLLLGQLSALTGQEEVYYLCWSPTTQRHLENRSCPEPLVQLAQVAWSQGQAQWTPECTALPLNLGDDRLGVLALRHPESWAPGDRVVLQGLSDLGALALARWTTSAGPADAPEPEPTERTGVPQDVTRPTRPLALAATADDVIRQALAVAQAMLPHGTALYTELRDGHWVRRGQVGPTAQGGPADPEHGQETGARPGPDTDLTQAGLPDTGLSGAAPTIQAAWTTGQAVFQDASASAPDTPDQPWATARLPVRVQGVVCGHLTLTGKGPHLWAPHEQDLLARLASQLGTALERAEEALATARRGDELERRNATLAARILALEGASALSRNLTLESDPLLLVGQTQELLIELLPGSLSTYYELRGERWQLCSHRGTFPAAMLGALQAGLPRGRTPNVDRPYDEHTTLYQDVFDPLTVPAVNLGADIRASASAPVWVGGQIQGVLLVGRFETHVWSGTDRNMLETVLFSLQLALERALQTRALQRRSAELERSNAELERFAFIASHDLQEPLRTVAIFTDRILQASDPDRSPQLTRYGRYVEDNITRMQTLLRDLLAFTRIGTRGQQVVTTDPARQLATVLREYRTRIEQTGAVVTTGTLPLVQADVNLLQQIFRQLLSNALKFTRPGHPPAIRVSAEVTGGWVTLRVQDNGIGIAPEYAEQVFMVFQRLHSREQYGGNGIGLSIARRITEQHGGKMWLEARPGEGTTVHFTLPAAT